MVAKSFQSMTQIGEPFESNKKMYVVVRNEKTGNERTVRWYSAQEYAKMYPEEKVEAAASKFKNLKKVLGFTQGFITVFKKSNAEQYQELFRKSNARYHVSFGWYIVSTEEVPEELNKCGPARLAWEDVSTSDDQLRPSGAIETAIKKLYVEEAGIAHYGVIGQRYEFNVVITDIIPIGANAYGSVIRYNFKQDNFDFYWITKERNMNVGDTWHMRGTVKAHEEDGTVLTRCIGVK